eukprot:m.65811 g.65811  ORF g.65811 m.65811 type:complete len:615 (-) comp7355_c0_seq3:110-1954(-)
MDILARRGVRALIRDIESASLQSRDALEQLAHIAWDRRLRQFYELQGLDAVYICISKGGGLSAPQELVLAALGACENIASTQAKVMMSQDPSREARTTTWDAWASSEMLSFIITYIRERRSTAQTSTTAMALGVVYHLTNDPGISAQTLTMGLHTVCIDLLREAARDSMEIADSSPAWLAMQIINNLAMWPANKTFLLAAGTVDAIVSFSKISALSQGMRMAICTSLAYLIGSKEDKDNVLLVTEPDTIEHVVKALRATIRGHPYKDTHFSVWELLAALRNLARNDLNKPKLATKETLQLLLRSIGSKNLGEVELASATLLELSFNEAARSHLRSPSLYARQILSNLQRKFHGGVGRTIDQLRWALSQGRPLPSRHAHMHGEATAGHVMISYSWANKSTVVRLARQLQHAGLPVWIDVDQMTGSTVEAMAEAIENAAVVVIAVSHDYKESANCRLEAEYALKQRKPLVFMRLQRDYVPTGWLGLMQGEKFYYDISAGIAANTFARLTEELTRTVNVTPRASAGPGCIEVQGREVAALAVHDVQGWALEHGLGLAVVKTLADKSVDGQYLQELAGAVRDPALLSAAVSLQSGLQLPSLRDGLALARALQTVSECD